jgi:hypothetical protein
VRLDLRAKHGVLEQSRYVDCCQRVGSVVFVLVLLAVVVAVLDGLGASLGLRLVLRSIGRGKRFRPVLRSGHCPLVVGHCILHECYAHST